MTRKVSEISNRKFRLNGKCPTFHYTRNLLSENHARLELRTVKTRVRYILDVFFFFFTSSNLGRDHHLYAVTRAILRANYLKMSKQRQHLCNSYCKTLSFFCCCCYYLVQPRPPSLSSGVLSIQPISDILLN